MLSRITSGIMKTKEVICVEEDFYFSSQFSCRTVFNNLKKRQCNREPQHFQGTVMAVHIQDRHAVALPVHLDSSAQWWNLQWLYPAAGCCSLLLDSPDLSENTPSSLLKFEWVLLETESGKGLNSQLSVLRNVSPYKYIIWVFLYRQFKA